MAEELKTSAPVELVIDDGSVTYEIKNLKGEVIGEYTFTPTDIGIYERFVQMRNEIDAIAEPLEKMHDSMTVEEFVEASVEIKNRIYDAVNKVFGANGAEKLFAKLHPLTPVGGRFYFDRVLEVVGEQINAAYQAETEKFSAHVEKYTNRAQRRAKK